MYSKIVGYKDNYKGTSYTKRYITDKEEIEINNEALNNNDGLTYIQIRLNQKNKTKYDNPVIEYFILTSNYNILTKEEKEELNNNIRIEFKKMW